ncbi:MAG: 1-acyl-sn-glycerol-3-phosphate acyltransferase [Lachnospiraceae bacterium]|nr:1-acyl-sn-glycerol-3-phosphate acyltransferase [Lachnospiraceae bacterium]
MFRFYYLIVISFGLIVYYDLRAKYVLEHEDKFDGEYRYRLVQRVFYLIKRNANIRTVSSGEEKLPREGGYIMYSNHQGKYDLIGIVTSHEEPCTFVMDEEKSRELLTDKVVRLLDGKRLVKNDIRQQIKELNVMVDEVKNGRRYVYFPEGGYDDNGNRLQEFKPGAFKCAKSAHAPIVPVAIYDSYIVFGFSSLRRVTTQVKYLDPIYFEEYGDMSTQQISYMVKQRIAEQIPVLEENRIKNGYNSWFYKKMDKNAG